jgi:hypothetical protein
MANIFAVSSAPISFVDGNGKQYSIPLSFISYASAAGAPTVSPNWPSWSRLSSTLQQAITTWLGVLNTQGFITPAPPSPASPAFTATAAAVGSTGNDISIMFNSQNADGSLNVTVSTTQKYSGLNYASGAANSIEQVLGTTATNGAEPGLAFVSTVPTAAPTATANPVSFTILGGGTNYELDLPGSNGVLTASANPTNADAGLITAAVSNVNSSAGTFDLTLSWSKTVASVTPAAMQSNFGYLISVAAPVGGFGPTPAAPSGITLAGGADATSALAVAASATVISG